MLIDATSMPAPRLELRWTKTGKTWRSQKRCTYLLILPLQDGDIRRDQIDYTVLPREWHGTLPVALGETTSSGGYQPLRGQAIERPYRDGSHALNDARAMGHIPVYAVCDGRAMLVEPL